MENILEIPEEIFPEDGGDVDLTTGSLTDFL